MSLNSHWAAAVFRTNALMHRVPPGKRREVVDADWTRLLREIEKAKHDGDDATAIATVDQWEKHATDRMHAAIGKQGSRS